MEACLIIPAVYVKPFLKGQKNDYNDAEAIAEATLRPNLRVIKEKSQDQLDLQACHRVRSRLVSRRTATINQIRAFMIEQGIAVRTGPRALRNTQTLVANYRPALGAILLLLGRLMRRTGQRAMFEKTQNIAKIDDWIFDSYAFDQVCWAVSTLMEGLRPPSSRAFRQPKGAYLTAFIPETIGHDFAQAQLWKLLNPEDPGEMPNSAEYLELQAFAREIGELLGPDFMSRITVPEKAGRKDAAKRLAAAKENAPVLAASDEAETPKVDPEIKIPVSAPPSPRRRRTPLGKPVGDGAD